MDVGVRTATLKLQNSAYSALKALALGEAKRQAFAAKKPARISPISLIR